MIEYNIIIEEGQAIAMHLMTHFQVRKGTTTLT